MNARCRFAVRGLAVCCFLSVLRPLAAGSAPEDFSIKLFYPAKVGDRMLLTGSRQADEEMVVTASGKENRQEKHAAYRFAVIQRVVATGAKGNSLRTELTVQRLTREQDGATTELLKAGDVISIRLEGNERVWEMGGAPLAAELKEALSDLEGVSADDEPTDDEVFATSQRRRVGDSWPADAKLVASKLTRRGIPVKAADVTGTAVLGGTKLVQGRPCLEVRISVELRNVKPPGEELLPPGLVMEPLTMHATSASVVPVDGARAALEETTEVKAPLLAKGEVQGVAITLRGEIRRAVNVKTSPVS